MNQINRWFVCAASVLAVSLLCSCTSTYNPSQSSSPPKYSVEQARAEILGEAVPPVYFFDRRDESIALNSPVYMISKVDIGNTSMRVVTGYKRYNIPLMNIQPSIFRDDSDGNCYVDVYISNVQGFYGNILSLNSAGQHAGLYDRPYRPERARDFADALLVLKVAATKFVGDDEARFQEAAANYPESAAKPPLPEAARRFKVQAEDAINDKDFNAAADLYGQGLEVAPWWPAGHFNRALVLSESDDYPDAIIEMKRYLILVPDASDAHAAQDKIYQWERKASTPN